MKNILFRHRAAQGIRQFLNGQGFIEVETPILTKSTPEGPGITWCPAGSSRGSSSPCPSRRSSSSSS